MKSKLFKLLIAVLVLLVAGLNFALAEESSSKASEEESDLSASLNAESLSKYVWRGQVLTDNWVFQPSVDLSWKTLNASVWGNMDLVKDNDQAGEFSELDYTIEQADALPIGPEGFGYSLGLVHYSMHGNDNPDMTEVFWGFNYEDDLFNPGIKFFHDTDEFQRDYILFSVEHSFEKIFEISEEVPVGMKVGASLGWGSKHYNQWYWEPEVDEEALCLSRGFNDLNFKVAFPIELPDNWSITPSVMYTHLVDKDIRKSDVYNEKSDYLVFGIGLSKAF
jgi:hypothetical protein